jgi:GNAT superfamily N-acetyltransferase
VAPTTAVTPTVAVLDVADAGAALTVQYAAYLAEARRYGTTEIPPLRETLAEIAADVADPATRALGAWLGPRLVGSVRLRRGADGSREFARFTVAPDVQGCGVGGALLAAAHEGLPPGTVTWLVSGARSDDNLRRYVRAGYVESGRLTDDAGVELVRMRRVAP